MASNKGIREQIAEANKKRLDYKSLMELLNQAADSKSQKARDLTSKGKFTAAINELKETTQAEDAVVDLSAKHHYELAKLYALDSQTWNALPEYEMAHRLRPNDQTYALGYAEALSVEGQFDDSAKLYTDLLPVLKQMAKLNPSDNTVALLSAMIGLSADHIGNKNWDAAKSSLQECFLLLDGMPGDSANQKWMYQLVALQLKSTVYAAIAEENDEEDDDDDSKEAMKALQEAMTLLINSATGSPAYVALIRGESHALKGETKQAEEFFQSALKLSQAAAKRKDVDPIAAEVVQIQAQESLATLYADDDNRVQDAEQAYSEAVRLCRDLATRASAYKVLLPDVLLSYAGFEEGQLSPPATFGRTLAEADQKSKEAFQAWVKDLDDSKSQPGKTRGAVEKSYADAVDTISQLAEIEPHRYRNQLVSALLKQAAFCSETYLYEEAEAAYERALALERDSIASQTSHLELTYCRTLLSASNFYRDDEKDASKADRAEREAIAKLRELAAQHSTDAAIELIGALLRIGSRDDRLGDTAGAAQAYSEAWEICDQIADVTDSVESATQIQMTFQYASAFFPRAHMQKEYDQMMLKMQNLFAKRWYARQSFDYMFMVGSLGDVGNYYRHAKRYSIAFGFFLEGAEIEYEKAQSQDDSSYSDLAETLLTLGVETLAEARTSSKLAQEYVGALEAVGQCTPRCQKQVLEHLQATGQAYRQNEQTNQATGIGEAP